MRLCVISDLTLAIGALKEEQIFKDLQKTNIPESPAGTATNLITKSASKAKLGLEIDCSETYATDKPAYNVGKLHQKEAEMEETK
ncbi:hypothetical protein HUJ05_011319 [Dendroctonus ponderosae]|nr:hypothetical protein HUJ05_011319 [Dendroctonus ponderosae]